MRIRELDLDPPPGQVVEPPPDNTEGMSAEARSANELWAFACGGKRPTRQPVPPQPAQLGKLHVVLNMQFQAAAGHVRIWNGTQMSCITPREFLQRAHSIGDGRLTWAQPGLMDRILECYQEAIQQAQQQPPVRVTTSAAVSDAQLLHSVRIDDGQPLLFRDMRTSENPPSLTLQGVVGPRPVLEALVRHGRGLRMHKIDVTLQRVGWSTSGHYSFCGFLVQAGMTSQANDMSVCEGLQFHLVPNDPFVPTNPVEDMDVPAQTTVAADSPHRWQQPDPF